MDTRAGQRSGTSRPAVLSYSRSHQHLADFLRVHRAVWLGSLAGALLGCGGRGPAAAPTTPAATAPRILALSRVIVLETAGPPPSDPSVSFAPGPPPPIVPRQGPPENIVFATLTFPAGAFADSGQTVTVGVKPDLGCMGSISPAVFHSAPLPS